MDSKVLLLKRFRFEIVLLFLFVVCSFVLFEWNGAIQTNTKKVWTILQIASIVGAYKKLK